MKNRNHTIVASLLTALAGTAAADVLTVGPNLTDYDYLTITAAIAGSASGDEIVIAPGIYPENLTINGKDLTLRNAGGGDVTIFGQNLARCLNLISGSGSDVVLRGLIFTGGRDNVGAGIAVSQTCSVIAEDCVIEGNTATDFGGGFYVSGEGTFTNVTFRNNTAANLAGGGVSYGNEASDTMFIDCLFEDNNALHGAGFVYHKAGIRTSMVGCTFLNNHATGRGGAIAVYGTAAVGDLRVDNCLFDSNRADLEGGAIWVTDQDVFRAVNSVFLNNSAANNGGAVDNEQIFDATNCTFYGNAVDAAGVNDTFDSHRADADTNLLNCIVVNESAGSKSGPGDLSARRSLIPDVANTAPDAFGNLTGDPMFVDAAMGDLRLSSGSAAIDAGDSMGELGSVRVLTLIHDFDGADRNVDDTDAPNIGVPAWALNIDMGAHEYQPEAAPDCIADLNGDTVLDFFDVLRYLELFNAGCP